MAEPVSISVVWDAKDGGVRLIAAIAQLTLRAAQEGLSPEGITLSLQYCADRAAKEQFK